MLKSIRTIVKWFWGIVATCLISLAVLVAVGRELAPQLSSYHSEIEDYLSTAMSVDVSFEQLTAQWEGLSPQARVRGLILRNPAGEDILTVDTAVAELSLLRSLWQRELVWRNLELVRINMGLRQNIDRSWSLIGFPSSVSHDPLVIDDPLDVFFTSRYLELRQANLRFEFRTGHSSEVNLPNLTMENSGNFHRLASEVNIADSEESLRLVVEGRGDPRFYNNFTAQGYLRLQEFELDKALAALPGELWEGLPDEEWRQGHQLDLEVWFDILPGMEVQTRGRIDVGELPVSFSEQLVFPTRSGANFAGRWQDDGSWSLSLRDLLLDWGNVQSPPADLVIHSKGFGQAVSVQMARLELQPWLSTMVSAQVLPEAVQQVLDQVQPRGTLENVEFVVEGSDATEIRLRSELKQLAVESFNGAPQLQHLDGYIEVTPEQGFVEVNSQGGFNMHFPTVHDQSLAFTEAQGRIHWQLDNERRAVKIHSDRLSVSGAAEQAAGYFSLFVPYEFGSEPELLTVQIGIENADLADYGQYLPRFLPVGLREWLDASIGQGVARRGGFIYHGGLTAESRDRSAVQLYLETADSDFQFHPDWPGIRQVAGELWLNDTLVTARLSDAKILDSDITEAYIEATPQFDDQGSLDLHIAGSAHGDASDALAFIQQSPLQDSLGKELADWQAQGEMEVDVELALPLRFAPTPAKSEEQETPVPTVASEEKQWGRQYIEFRPKQVALMLMPGDLSFEKVTGKVIYDSTKGLDSNNLSADFLGQPISVTMSGDDNNKNDENAVIPLKRQQLFLTAVGDFPVQAFANWLPASVQALLNGEANFQAALIMPFDGSVGELEITSSLQGLAIDLPPPFLKVPDQAQPMRLQIPIGDPDAVLSFQYHDLVDARVELSEQTVEKIAIGITEPPQDLGTKLSINGWLDEFNVAAWQQVLETWQTNSSGADQVAGQETVNDISTLVNNSDLVALLNDFSPRAQLEFDRFNAGELTLENLQLGVQRENRSWQFALDSAMVKGNIQLFDDSKQPVQVDLAHLRWPEPAQEKPPRNPFLPPVAHDPLQDWEPQLIPAMDVQLADFSVADEEYGRWSFELRPTERGLAITGLMAELRGGRIVGSGENSGAKLWWEERGGELQSRFEGRFATNQMAEVLAQWQQPELLDSEAAYFDAVLSWLGSPAAISTLGIWGDVSLVMENGSFYQDEGNPSAGNAMLQLISFLNFDSWMRRLRLDFSDLGRRGMPFDQVVGQLEFAEGQVVMNTPLLVNTPSGKFQFTGSLDLLRNDVDAVLIATLPVGGNLTLFTAVAAGLPAALGVYVVSKVFEKQMNKVASLRYRVTGSLSDPEFKFDRLFDDDAAMPVATPPTD